MQLIGSYGFVLFGFVVFVIVGILWWQEKNQSPEKILKWCWGKVIAIVKWIWKKIKWCSEKISAGAKWVWNHKKEKKVWMPALTALALIILAFLGFGVVSTVKAISRTFSGLDVDAVKPPPGLWAKISPWAWLPVCGILTLVGIFIVALWIQRRKTSTPATTVPQTASGATTPSTKKPFLLKHWVIGLSTLAGLIVLWQVMVRFVPEKYWEPAFKSEYRWITYPAIVLVLGIGILLLTRKKHAAEKGGYSVYHGGFGERSKGWMFLALALLFFVWGGYMLIAIIGARNVFTKPVVDTGSIAEEWTEVYPDAWKEISLQLGIQTTVSVKDGERIRLQIGWREFVKTSTNIIEITRTPSGIKTEEYSLENSPMAIGSSMRIRSDMPISARVRIQRDPIR